MASSLKLIVGLGNPGPEYAATRHNIGFMAVDALADGMGATGWKKKFRGQAASLGDPALLFLKPETYMNVSGEAVGEAIRFHKIKPQDVIVLHDDLDLPPGQVRVKQGGGTGGHNGLKSLDAHITPNYWRIRLGIGHPLSAPGSDQSRADRGEIVSNYVLHTFAKSDEKWLTPLMELLAREFPLMLEGKRDDFQKQMTTGMKAHLAPPKQTPEKAKED